MNAKPGEKPSNLVPHPRYGTEIQHSGTEVAPNVVRQSFWRYRSETIFPETAIAADVSKQNFSMYPRTYYVDILMNCDECKRDFIFFAKEQVHWYEELGFYVDAWCNHCSECRQERQESKRRFAEYSDLIVQHELSDSQLTHLTTIAITLWKQGELKNEHNLRRLKNRATTQIPESTATAAIIELIESLTE